MKKLILAVAACAMMGAFAEETTTDKPAAAQKPSREKLMMTMGGRIVKPGSQQGRIAFVDTQSEIAGKNIDEVIALIDHQTKQKITHEKAAPAKPADIKAKSGANAVVILVANDNDAPMTVAQEEGWAVVNVRKLKKGLADNALAPKMHEARCRKELIRAFCNLCGCLGSPYKKSLLNAMSVEQLDLCPEEIPYDSMQICVDNMTKLGVTPKVEVWYRQAVKEGWAPAPTDKYQQSAWDKVKAEKEKGPSNPIKIAPPRK